MKSGVDRTIFHIILRAQNYFLGRSAAVCKSRSMITWDCSTIWIRCVSRVRRLRSHKLFAPCRKIWMNHNLLDWLPFIYTSHSSLGTRPDMKPFPKSGLIGHGCSLHIQNQDKEPKFWICMNQRTMTISKSISRCQSPVRNLQRPPKPQMRT